MENKVLIGILIILTIISSASAEVTVPQTGDLYWSLTSYSGRDVLWCGTNDGGYSTPPGYGHYWDQSIVKEFVIPSGSSSIEYDIQYDTEPGFDYVYLMISVDGGSNYVTLTQYDFSSGGFISDSIDISDYAEQTALIKFRFVSDNGYDDEDGEVDTDGAFRLDYVQVTGFSADTFNTGLDGWDTSFNGDGDGYWGTYDCDDGNPDINPGAIEICGDLIDNDCDGAIDNEDPDCSGESGCFFSSSFLPDCNAACQAKGYGSGIAPSDGTCLCDDGDQQQCDTFCEDSTVIVWMGTNPLRFCEYAEASTKKIVSQSNIVFQLSDETDVTTVGQTGRHDVYVKDDNGDFVGILDVDFDLAVSDITVEDLTVETDAIAGKALMHHLPFTDAAIQGGYILVPWLGAGYEGYHCPNAEALEDVTPSCSSKTTGYTDLVNIGGTDYIKMPNQGGGNEGGGAVPEFSDFGWILAAVLGTGGFILIRRRKH